jgi:cell wall-associated NlpC family hydrolase
MAETTAQRFTRLALAQVGKRYIFGYEVKLTDPSPKAFDCSELVQWLYFQCGYRVPDGSYNQYPKTVALASGAKLKVGDPYFFKNAKGKVYHVGVYVGGGWCVEARGKVYGVVKMTVKQVKARGGIFRRFVKDLDGKNVMLEPAVDPRVFFWNLIHADGVRTNKLKAFCDAEDIAWGHKQTDQTTFLNMAKELAKLV